MKIGYAKKTGVLFLSIFLITSCAKKKEGEKAERKETVIAVVGDHKITDVMLEKRMAEFAPALRARYSSPEGKKEFLEKLVEEKVLLYAGKVKGYDKDPEIQERIEQYLSNLYRGRIYMEVSKEIPSKIDQQKLKEYYDSHINEFMTPPMVRLRRLVTDTEEKAKRALQELKRGVPFERVLQKYCTDKSLVERKGDTNYLRKGGIYPPELNEPAFALQKPGDISDIIKTSRGWEIIQLIDKKEPEPEDFLAAIPKIRQKIIMDLRNEMVERTLDEIRTKVGVEIYWDRFEKIFGAPAPAQEQGQPQPQE
jgi:hypothetical protein